MASLIRSAVAGLWLIATGVIGYVAYAAIRTEHTPQAIWAWFILCAFAFISATWLAYNVLFAHNNPDQ